MSIKCIPCLEEHNQRKGCDKTGGLWRIGSGFSVQVWGGNWLPKFGCSKVISPMAKGCATTRVGDLIDQENRIWKEDLIDRVFYDFEASTIKNIPLCRSLQDDILIWPFNPDSVYSVKSSYRFLLDSCLACQPSSSMSNTLQ